MLPIKLTMSAFGSYLKKTEIDFQKLGRKGIYLITGDTGSGKTTIFDAVSYALFGTGSGDYRDKSTMFRSEYASVRDETYVEFEFEYHGKIYKVKRAPSYQRAKKVGEGTTLSAAVDELILPEEMGKENRVISKSAAVNEYITRLLGINREQFAQIVMLPQGRFMTFLMSDTKEKEKIFGDIFRTRLYKQLQFRLKEKYLERQNEIKTRKRELSGKVAEISCGRESAVYEDICLLKEKHDRGEEISGEIAAEKIGVINSELEAALKKNRSLLENIAVETEKIKEDIRIYENNRKIGEEIVSAQKQIMENIRLSEQMDEALSRAEKDAEQCPELIAKYSNIESRLPQYREREELLKELKQTENSLKLKTAKLRELQEENGKREELAQKSREQLGAINIPEGEETELSRQQERYTRESESLKGLEKKLEEFKSREKRYLAEQEKFCQLVTRYRKINDEFIEKERIYDSEIAGVLAEKLSDNEPCPVCGSAVHPNPAKKSADTLSKEQLDKLEQEKTETGEEKNRQGEITLAAKADMEALKGQLSEQYREIFSEEPEDGLVSTERIAERKKELLSELSRIDNRLSEIKKQREDKKALEQKLSDMDKQGEQLRELLEKISSEIAEHEKNRAVLKAKADLIKPDYPDVETAEKECLKLKSEKKALEDNLALSRKKSEEIRQKISNLKAKTEVLKTKLIEKPQSEEQELLDRLAVLREEQEHIGTETDSMNYCLKSNSLTLKYIEKYLKEMGGKEKEYRVIKELSDLVNGSIRGKEQTTLEVRVQMIYFEKILRGANRFLLNMTGGQYELRRSTESSDGRRKSGLDLSVLDHFNQSQRDVRTLSGGESFKASLALALGMAGVIQENSGGIHIDTMFIDEGFGSLDDESLDQAVNTLNSLAENDRLIGIISHVTELKDRIDRKIVVSKSSCEGSRIRMET